MTSPRRVGPEVVTRNEEPSLLTEQSITYRHNKNTYEEFYPLGLTEYNDADLSTFDTITERYKNVLASHAGDFTAGFVTDYNTARALFKTSRQAQQTAMSNVANERSDMATTRPALAQQLTVPDGSDGVNQPRG